MEVLINLTEGILSPCVCTYIVPFKYLTILFVSYASIKLGGKACGNANRAEKLFMGHSITKCVNAAAHYIHGKQIVNYTFPQL